MYAEEEESPVTFYTACSGPYSPNLCKIKTSQKHLSNSREVKRRESTSVTNGDTEKGLVWQKKSGSKVEIEVKTPDVQKDRRASVKKVHRVMSRWRVRSLEPRNLDEGDKESAGTGVPGQREGCR